MNSLIHYISKRWISIQNKWLKTGIFGLWLIYLFMAGGACPALADQEQSAAFNLTATSASKGYPGLPFIDENQFYRPMNIIGSGGVNDFSYRFSLYGQTDYANFNNDHEYQLNSFQGEFKTSNQFIRIGDTYTRYSAYSLTHSVKGAVYSYTSEQQTGPEFSVIYGYNCSDWDQFWGKTTTRRLVQGLRYKQPLTSDFWIATNVLHAQDRLNSTADVGYGSSLISLDWHYQMLENLKFYGETAFSDTSLNSATETAENTEYSGTAHRLKGLLTHAVTDFELEYEYIDSDFVSLLTDTTADREKLSGRLRYHHSAKTEYTLSLLWYHDDLAGQLDYRTDHYQPGIAFKRKQLFKRPHAELNTSYTYKYSASEEIEQQHHYLTLSYLDHFGPLISCSNLNIIFYDNARAANGDEYTYNTSLSSNFKATPKIHLKPELRLGGWMINDELNDAQQQVWEYSLGLKISIPEKNFETYVRVGQNQLIDKNDEDIAKILANININYQLNKSLQRTTQLYLQGYINDYSYTTASNNYSEVSFSSGLHITF